MISRREWIRTAGVGLAGAVALGSGITVGSEAAMEDDMVLIPEGKFTMGTSARQVEALAKQYGHHPSWLSGEMPAREIDLPAFRIDRFPVTNAEYAEFCRAAGHPPRPHWPGGKVPDRLRKHPVVFVNLMDAQAYANWAGKGLPTEAQWEKAARGSEGLVYPWGNEFEPEACQFNNTPATHGPGTAPIDAHPSGASPYGVMDMVGNVGEWCGDSPGPGSAIIKGGAWVHENPINLRPAARNMSGFASNASDFYGFRCVKEAE